MNLGLLGCGRIAEIAHLPALRGLSGIRVTAVAERDPQRRLAAARLAPDAAIFSDWRELLDSGLAGAIIVALPNDLHAAAARVALETGHHVYIEKPMATSVAEGEALLDAGRAADRTAMTGFNYRFHPTILALRARIRAGTIGELRSIRSVFSIHEPDTPAWKRTRSTGGGALLDLGSHHIDLARYLFDREVEEVQCRIQSLRSEDDTAFLQLRLGGDLFMQSFFSFDSVEENAVQIYGWAGRLSADWNLSPYVDHLPSKLERGRTRRLWNAVRPLLGRPPLFDRFARPLYVRSFRAALTHFLECAGSGRAAEPGLEDGLRCLQVVEAAEAAGRSGAPVRLPSDAA